MMSDDFRETLIEIKRKIYEEERIEELLEKIGCQNIKPKHNRFEAMLPDKFDSNNSRSVQCYMNENLSCRIRSRSISNIDIYGLVSFIVFECDSDRLNKNIFKAKDWICEQLGYDGFTDVFVKEEPKENPLKWLHDLKKWRHKKKFEPKQNKIYDASILNQYINFPHQLYINEGIDYKTQVEFQIGFDIASERIVWPIHNEYGEVISVKGRTVDPSYKEKEIYKFLYFYNYNKIVEWYNWHRAVYYILEKKEVVIYEAEKTCWLSSQFGYRNCLAIAGDDVSDFQVQMIKSLGLEIDIVLAFDKDKSADDIKKQAKKFGVVRPIYAMWDGRKVFSAEEKHSPTDLGSAAFEQLYEDRLKYRIC